MEGHVEESKNPMQSNELIIKVVHAKPYHHQHRIGFFQLQRQVLERGRNACFALSSRLLRSTKYWNRDVLHARV
jgi:hypothetical protein